MTKHYLVLDFGGSAVKCAVMTECAEMLEHFSLPSQAQSYQDWLDGFTPYFEKYNQEYAFSGIAISTCGAVDVESGVIGGASSLPYIHGFDVRALYKKQFGIPVELENDACCAALAEAWLGAGKSSGHFCTVVIGSGIGGAIVTGKKVQKGHNLHGGEFGFAITEFQNGKPVIWGNLASTKALVKSVASALNFDENKLNGRTVFEMADAGNDIVRKLIDDWYLKLATGMYNIQYHVDPELILIGGAVSRREGFIDRINEKLDGILQSIPIPTIRPRLRVSKFGNDANLIGALRHYLNRQEQ
ncbi:ROK family protein [Vibrio sp. JC009]|uniref:ROK family protein n=1 Tax=Vibrio sp. JC009 TaxID=2912314 RepID=UPI0023B119BC|nr:ROK family protein [Vibrio sp. JC009]WED23711.1 ROK family protein [Vibrio sp. JC009]